MLAVGHARHDGVLIASTVDRRLATPSSLAQALLAACTECARLHADLLALAAALPFAATPRRTRDFTLSAADADRLRPRGLARWVRLIGSSRDTLTRPLAIGFTTLGLAGLLVATVPGALPGSSSGTVLSTVGNSVAPAEAAPDPTLPMLQMSPAPPAPSAAPSVDDGGVFGGADIGDPDAAASQRTAAGDAPSEAIDEAAVRDDPSGISTLLVIAGIMTILGLGLFALRWSAGRFGQ